MTTRPKTQNLEAWRKAALWSEREFEELCCGLTPGGARECTADLNAAGEEIRRAVLAKLFPCICPTDATAGDKLYGHARFFRPVDVIPWAAERFSAFPFAPVATMSASGGAEAASKGMVAWKAEMVRLWQQIVKAKKDNARDAIGWLQEHGPADVFVRGKNHRDQFEWIDTNGNRQTTTIPTVQNAISTLRRKGVLPPKQR